MITKYLYSISFEEGFDERVNQHAGARLPLFLPTHNPRGILLFRQMFLQFFFPTTVHGGISSRISHFGPRVYRIWLVIGNPQIWPCGISFRISQFKYEVILLFSIWFMFLDLQSNEEYADPLISIWVVNLSVFVLLGFTY